MVNHSALNTDLLLERLLKANRLSRCNQKLVHDFSRKWCVSSFDALLECRIFSEIQLAVILGEVFELPVISDLNDVEIASASLQKAGYSLCKMMRALPRDEGTGTHPNWIIADPTNVHWTQSKLSNPTGVAVAPLSAILKTIDERTPLAQQLGG